MWKTFKNVIFYNESCFIGTCDCKTKKNQQQRTNFFQLKFVSKPNVNGSISKKERKG